MIEDVAVSTAKRSHIVTREIVAHLATFLLFPFGVKHTKRRTARQKDQRTIVLIHGYLGNRSSFLPLAAYLKLKGAGKVLTFNYKWNTGPEQAAKELKAFLKNHVRGGRIDLVGHSLGGIISRIYLQELGGSRRVDRCITLGTPHEGTYNAYWVASKVGDSLRPNSRLLKRLKATRAVAANVRFCAIVGGSDNVVLPRIFAANGGDVVYLPNVGHLGILFSPAVFRAVTERLLEPVARVNELATA